MARLVKPAEIKYTHSDLISSLANILENIKFSVLREARRREGYKGRKEEKRGDNKFF